MYNVITNEIEEKEVEAEELKASYRCYNTNYFPVIHKNKFRKDKTYIVSYYNKNYFYITDVKISLEECKKVFLDYFQNKINLLLSNVKIIEEIEDWK